MRKIFNYLLLVLATLCLTFCNKTDPAVSTPTGFDLSGTWEFILKEQPNTTVNLIFSTTKQNIVLENQTFEYYPFVPQGKNFTDLGDNSYYLGAFLYTNPETSRQAIVWIQLNDENQPAEGNNLDTESSMILSQDGNTLILGGDFEEYEISRMTKTIN